ncbi:hypothetical protein PVAND_005108 [Polypedilum vanderplanki]|uniref:Uncharacterized protein n=1 Tax=Polypedilum vanderplanki TaxID=319348 RepID=A0A9J6BZD4_POLVA|nr:hypothetical protein PVAND_005108 [Polypedilum vanderplanki]
MDVVENNNKDIEKLTDKVNELRVKVRNDLDRFRQIKRSAAFNKNRFLENEILTEEDIKGLCSRIKRRKHADEEDLIKLGNAFFQSENNISAFIKTTGAIKVLIKEFIGKDRRLLAAQCLCNLSLGCEAACSKIAIFGGCYLNIYLRNLKDFNLVKVSLWITQNLASTCHKALDILMSQEVLSNCLFIINDSGDAEIRHKGIILLDIIIEKSWNKIGIDEKETVIKSLFNYIIKNNSDYMALQAFHRTLDSNAWPLNVEESQKLTSLLTFNLLKFNNDSNDTLIYFSIKILSKLFNVSLEYLSQFLLLFVQDDKKLSNIINESFKLPKFYSIGKELFTFAASIYQTEHAVVIDYLNYDNLEVNLNIPKIFE